MPSGWAICSRARRSGMTRVRPRRSITPAAASWPRARAPVSRVPPTWLARAGGCGAKYAAARLEAVLADLVPADLMVEAAPGGTASFTFQVEVGCDLDPIVNVVDVTSGPTTLTALAATQVTAGSGCGGGGPPTRPGRSRAPGPAPQPLTRPGRDPPVRGPRPPRPRRKGRRGPRPPQLAPSPPLNAHSPATQPRLRSTRLQGRPAVTTRHAARPSSAGPP